jgi:hypothetical protein
MSKKKDGKTRNRAPNRLKKALSSTLLAGAILVPVTQATGKDKPLDLTINQRITRIREAINNRVAQNNTNLDEILSKVSYEESEVTQWGNWRNWGNWANWANWNNWNNWGNWLNWGNF